MAILQMIYLSLIFLPIDQILAETPCGDWSPYKDEKCLKIFTAPGLLSYQDSESFCATTDDSHLLSIELEDKQQFLQNFLQTNQVVDNIWIGLKFLNGNYEWSDDSQLLYTNWAFGSPKNDTDHCVQVLADDVDYGKWSDVPCSKKNLVVCEKIQGWSSSYLQNKVVELELAVNQSQETEKQLNERITNLENILGELQTTVVNLQNSVTSLTQNPVPIGFIYVQLPNEVPPSDVWPSVGWQDVSANYAGVFFRVEGGGSAAFGEVQGDNSPRLLHVHKYVGPEHTTLDDIETPANGELSVPIDSERTEHKGIGMQFLVSGGEVRPKNMAIRVWKRIN